MSHQSLIQFRIKPVTKAKKEMKEEKHNIEEQKEEYIQVNNLDENHSPSFASAPLKPHTHTHIGYVLYREEEVRIKRKT